MAQPNTQANALGISNALDDLASVGSKLLGMTTRPKLTNK